MQHICARMVMDGTTEFPRQEIIEKGRKDNLNNGTTKFPRQEIIEKGKKIISIMEPPNFHARRLLRREEKIMEPQNFHAGRFYARFGHIHCACLQILELKVVHTVCHRQYNTA